MYSAKGYVSLGVVTDPNMLKRGRGYFAFATRRQRQMEWHAFTSPLALWHYHGKVTNASADSAKSSQNWYGLMGKDVFAILPTRYGKSLCYASLPSAAE